MFVLQLLEQLLLQDANARSAGHTGQACVAGAAGEQQVVAGGRAGGRKARVPASPAQRLKQCRQAPAAMVRTSWGRAARLPARLPAALVHLSVESATTRMALVWA
jgi:hypothetical protein